MSYVYFQKSISKLLFCFSYILSYNNYWNNSVLAAAAAKSLQSCLTLLDPMDCSLPGSSAHGIFQARVLEWGAIAFSDSVLGDLINRWHSVIFECPCPHKWHCVCVYWCVVDLQYFVSCRYTPKWISYSHTYIHSFQSLFPYRSLQSIEFPVLCSRLLAIYFIYAGMYMSIPTSQFMPPSLLPI